MKDIFFPLTLLQNPFLIGLDFEIKEKGCPQAPTWYDQTGTGRKEKRRAEGASSRPWSRVDIIKRGEQAKPCALVCTCIHAFSQISPWGECRRAGGSSSVCDGISGPETELELDGAGLEV